LHNTEDIFLVDIVIAVVWLAVNAFDRFTYGKHRIFSIRKNTNPILILKPLYFFSTIRMVMVTRDRSM
jgi:hypothetical protein